MKCQQDIDRFIRDDVIARRIATAVTLLLLACGGGPAAYAANWEFLPKIGVGAFTDDNYTLRPDTLEPVDVVGAEIDAEFAWRASTPLTTFTVVPRFVSTLIPDDDEWESNDGYLRLDWSHERQRLDAGLRAEYSDETTVRSELPSSDVDGDLGDPDEGDTGVVAVDNRRQRLTVRPRLSFDVTERSALLADAGYQDVGYDRDSAGNTEGYSNTSASIGYRFATSTTSGFTARGTASRYERDSDSLETDSYGVQVEWGSRLTEVTRWYVRVGAEEVDIPQSSQTTGGSTSETGFDGGIGAEWGFQVTRLFVDATSSVQPNASGRIIQRDELRLRLTRQFGPRFFGHLGARANRDTALSDDLGTFRDRDYATGALGLEWRMTREFSLVGQYDVTWQEHETDPSDATSNAFRLSIVYERHRKE